MKLLGSHMAYFNINLRLAAAFCR